MQISCFLVIVYLCRQDSKITLLKTLGNCILVLLYTYYIYVYTHIYYIYYIYIYIYLIYTYIYICINLKREKNFVTMLLHFYNDKLK